MDRRKFLAVTGQGSTFAFTAALLGGSMTLEGCDALTELEQWIPEGIYTLDAVVLAINPPAGSVLAVLTAAIPKLWTAIDGGIAEYKSINPPPVGSLAKVTAAVNALSDQLSEIVAALPGVSLTGAELIAVEAGLKLLVSTLNYFAQKHGATPSAKAKTAALARNGATVPPAVSRADFAKKWNAIGFKRADGSLVTV